MVQGVERHEGSGFSLLTTEIPMVVADEKSGEAKIFATEATVESGLRQQAGRS